MLQAVKIQPGALLESRYRVTELLGRGGMGDVWRCRDLARDDDVAIKMVRSDEHGPDRRRDFYDEVIATAHLDHPAIVRVLDVLHPGDDLALVMELRSGIPLRDVGRVSCATAFALLTQVLEALAYAHARNVLHLDVKPGNVVVDLDAEEATLLDFGIARMWRADADVAFSARGTPAYMAPEQMAEAPGALGPWTDLYGFGVMTYELVSGSRPFDEADPMGRLGRPPPRLDAGALGLDARLGDLLMVLLAPRVEDRPTHAADVQHAIQSMSTDGMVRGYGRTQRQVTAATQAARMTETAPSSEDPPSGRRERQLDPVPLSRLRHRRVSSPVMPAVVDVTPGSDALFGLRESPVLGRADLRMELWQTVQASRHERRTSVVLLTGGAGQGKSRLARDVMERAHQTGLSHTAWTNWTHGGASNEGLRGLLESTTGSGGVHGDDLDAHLRRWARRYPGDDDARFVNDARLFLDHQGRRTEADLPLRVTTEALRRLSISRGVVVVLDDVHWAGEMAVAIVNRLRQLGGPVAVVATAREPRGELDADLEQHLEDLDPDALRAFIRGQIDLEDESLDELVERAEGNTLRASEALRDLVERDALIRTGVRYTLRFDELPLTCDLATLWARRLDRAAIDPADLAALALMRPRVNEPLFDALRRRAGSGLRRAVRRALRRGLLQKRHGDLHWAHDGLRAHVVAQVQDEARPDLHRMAAEALASQGQHEDVQAERAAHLHTAGDRVEACAALVDAIGFSLQAGDQAGRRDRAERLLDWSTTDETQVFRARALVELGHIAATERRPDEAAAKLEEARAVACEGPASAWLTFREAQILIALGRPEEGRRANERAAKLAVEHGVPEVRVQALGLSAVAAYRRNELERARGLFEQVIEAAVELGDAVTEAKACFYLANMAPTESLDLFVRAIETAQRAGAVSVELSARQVFADALFRLGRRDDAEREMKSVAAQAQHRRLRQLSSMVQIQLACWRLWDDDVEGAERHCARAREHGAAEGSVLERSMVAAIAAATAGARGNAEATDVALANLEAERGELDEPDLHRVLAWAAEHAAPALAPRFAVA